MQHDNNEGEAVINYVPEPRLRSALTTSRTYSSSARMSRRFCKAVPSAFEPEAEPGSVRVVTGAAAAGWQLPQQSCVRNRYTCRFVGANSRAARSQCKERDHVASHTAHGEATRECRGVDAAEAMLHPQRLRPRDTDRRVAHHAAPAPTQLCPAPVFLMQPPRKVYAVAALPSHGLKPLHGDSCEQHTLPSRASVGSRGCVGRVVMKVLRVAPTERDDAARQVDDSGLLQGGRLRRA